MGLSVVGKAPVKSAQLEAVVIRCGCNFVQRRRLDWHGRRNEVCPNPMLYEHLGVIAQYHRNPIVNWWRNLKRRLGR